MKEARRIRHQPEEGGDLLTNILAFPILGAPIMVHWVAQKLVEAAEQEALDEGKLQGKLLELQMQYELGEIDDEEYARQETAILERLNAIRKAKEEE